jgi:hypothetical protein
LHKMERAEGDEEAHTAAHRFLRWLEEFTQSGWTFEFRM